MDVSLAQTAGLTCPQCGEDFTADVWLIVDGSVDLILPIFVLRELACFREVSCGLL